MIRGFVEMDLLASQPSDGSTPRLQVGIARGLESVLAMRAGWRALADASDLPTTQFEWAVAAMNQPGTKLQASIMYVSDGSNLRAILPLLTKPKAGVEHLQYLSPAISMPIDIPHTDRPSLELLLAAVTRLGRPIHLSGMLANSPATALLREMAGDSKRKIHIAPAEPASYLDIPQFALQERSQSAARVSIIATSYGLSGGPNDVIFQFVAPSLDQVMHLYHESLQLHATGETAKPGSGAKRDLDTFEFLRTHAFHCAQRGEIRFSCMRLAGRLLAVQMLQVRKGTAWLLTAANLPRFRDTTMGTLLMGETIRKLQQESIQRLVLPSAASAKEVGECQQLPCVDVAIYPWNSRSLMALMIGRAGRVSTKLLRRRRGEAGSGK